MPARTGATGLPGNQCPIASNPPEKPPLHKKIFTAVFLPPPFVPHFALPSVQPVNRKIQPVTPRTIAFDAIRCQTGNCPGKACSNSLILERCWTAANQTIFFRFFACIPHCESDVMAPRSQNGCRHPAQLSHECWRAGGVLSGTGETTTATKSQPKTLCAISSLRRSQWGSARLG